MSDKRRGLGRGLGALIPTAPTAGRADRPVDVFFPEPDGTNAQPRGTAFGLSGSGNPQGSGDLARADDSPGVEETTEPTAPAETPWGDAVSAAETPQPQTAYGEPHTAYGGAGVPAGDVSRETAGGVHGSAEAPRAAVNASHGSDPTEVPDALEGDELVPVPGARFAEIPAECISPNPRQPRTVFDEDEMAELVQSVAEIGVLQPVVVRPVEVAAGSEPRYELVMGERRWRASQQAGLATVPAIVRETGDDDLLRDALLENLHRSQLNPLEEAAAYAQLLEDFGCTHDVLATRIGRSRPQISNTLRLLRLPPLVQRRVAAGVLSAGHARALLGLDDAAAIERLAQRVVAEGLSVRAVEEIVALGGDDAPTRRPRAPRAGNRHASLDELAQRLSDRFDTRVQIALGRRKGRLSVEFASVEDLNRILELLAPGDTATLGREDEGGAAVGPTGPGAAEFDAVGLGVSVEDASIDEVDADDAGYGLENQERAAG